MGERYSKLPSEILDTDILDFNINYYALMIGKKKDKELHDKEQRKANLKRR